MPTIPARINFGVTAELQTALETLADKADTCVAEVARDCIEAGIGERKLPGTANRDQKEGESCTLGVTYDYISRIPISQGAGSRRLRAWRAWTALLHAPKYDMEGRVFLEDCCEDLPVLVVEILIEFQQKFQQAEVQHELIR